jgi:hypothetical protein
MTEFKSIPQSYLPDSEKQRLCQQLLDEFGVNRVKIVERTGEMRHGCILPGGEHSDQQRNPTASLNYKKLTYKCLGCNQSGGLLWFIGIMRGCSGHQARKWLSKETGTDGEVQSLAKLLDLFDSLYSQRQTRPDIPKMSMKILKPWLLVHPYMTDVRKVPEKTLYHFRVGYGEFKQPDSDVVSKRIVIPAIWDGSLVGWQTRRLFNDGTPKYLSSADFPRDQIIYNFDPKRKEAIVVEAPMSCLRHWHHIDNIEPTFGASVADKQLNHLKKHRRLVLFMDNGDAGWNAACLGTHDFKGKLTRPSMAEVLSPYCQVDVVFNPYVKFDSEGRVIWLDPADLDDKTTEELVDAAVPYSVWRPPTMEDLQEYKPQGV